MAEVAIPLMALGSLYIMQNQKNKQESIYCHKKRQATKPP